MSDETFENSMAAAQPVQKYLELLQNVIERMARNSASCKTWCVTIVSAALVFLASSSRPDLLILALVPIFMFGALDAYYLSLEKGFRRKYEAVLKKVHSRSLLESELFELSIEGSPPISLLNAISSFSLIAFYPALAVLLFFIWAFVH